MSGPRLPNVHLNPRFQAQQQQPRRTTNAQVSHPVLPSGSVHVNPRFAPHSSAPQLPSTNQVHFNPNFKPEPGRKLMQPKQGTSAVHFNPNFDSSKALVNPNFIAVDQKEKEKFEAVIKAKTLEVAMKQQKKQKQPSMFINPKFYETTPKAPPVVAVVHHATPSTSTEKENNHGGMKGMMKFIRRPHAAVRKSNSPIYKKIGSKKLIRMKTPKTPQQQRNSPKTPLSKIRKRSAFSRTPLSTRKIINRLVTPLTLRRYRKVNVPKHSPERPATKNPFKVDNRPTPPPVSTIPRRRPPPPVMHMPMPSAPPPKPARTSLVAKSQVIHIEGVKFAVSEHGRQLRRVDPAPVLDGSMPAPGPLSNQRGAPIRCSVSRKLFLDGDEFVENDAGVLIRSRNSMTRASITSARNKSIHTLIKSQTRSKQYCMFYNKFGKCNKREKGVCPYLHDAAKVAVCRRFLMGSCHNDKCLLSHKVAPEKMPSCKFFLEGLCTKGEDCPYRHVKVNADAEVCQAFLRGHCETGEECKRRHVMLCPAFEQKGFCPKGSRCPWPHIKHGGAVAAAKSKKKPAPVKPKRKSISKADGVTGLPKVKAANRRYYQEEEGNKEEEEKSREQTENETHLEEKRQRLLSKIDLAKQGWTGLSSAPSAPTSSAASSSSSTSLQSRTPIGNLPQFIPLSQDSSDEEDDSSPAEPIYSTLKDKEEEKKKPGEQVDERLI